MYRFFGGIIHLFFLTLTISSFGQDSGDRYRVMFYNVENLFDTLNNPEKNDDDFTPEGSMKWDRIKYDQKLADVYKVIIAAGQWDPPVVVGFAEVENISVLNDLVNNTPLKKFKYKAILEEASDRRGIDVGMIYRSDIIKYISHKSIKVFTNNSSRDILLFTGVIHEDTVHFFVNHWPSRLSGKEHTEYLRAKASKQLINSIDSIFLAFHDPKVVVMGDFNDTPEDASIIQLLDRTFADRSGKMLNLKLYYQTEEDKGTVVHTDVFTQWYLFDQIIISPNLSAGSDMNIFKAPWLLNYSGRPNRTYLGNYYNGGISDHLPVYMDIIVR